MRKEFKDWTESGVDTCFLDIKKVNATDFIIECDFGDRCAFTITYPEDYPKGGTFFVYSEDESLADWMEQMSTFCESNDKLKLSELLDEAAGV